MEKTFKKGVLAACSVLIWLVCSCNRPDEARPTPPATPTAHEQKTSTAQRSEVLVRAAAVLDDLVQKPENAIPSAILNRTQCLVVVPRQMDRAGASAHGVASCRKKENSWGNPALVEFTPLPKRQVDSGDLLFLLSESVSQKLNRGELRLGPQSRAIAGPTVRDANLASNAELNQDVWVYIRQNGSLIGKAVTGRLTLQPSQQRPDAAFQQIVNVSRSGDLNAKFQASAVSFANTITPTGIIIHHSGIIPTSHQVPKDESQVDRFHQGRGFETICFGRLYHVAYHYLILPNGNIQTGRPERCQGAHAPGYNSYLGISLMGDFSSVDNPRGAKGNTRPTTKQMRSLVALCRRIAREYQIPLQRILRHSDVTSTLCPGDRFPFTSLLQKLEQQQ